MVIGSSPSCGASAAKALPASSRDTSGLVDQLGEILRIEQRLAERIEALADRFDLPLIPGKIEQSRRVAPC